MKKLIALIPIVIMGLSLGCQDGAVVLDSKARQAKIDSLFEVKKTALTDSVNQSCTTLMSKDYSAKIDSIVAARKAAS